MVNNLYNSLLYFASHGKTHHCQILGLIYNTPVRELQSLHIFIVLAKSLQDVKFKSVVLQKCLTRRRKFTAEAKTNYQRKGLCEILNDHPCVFALQVDSRWFSDSKYSVTCFYLGQYLPKKKESSLSLGNLLKGVSLPSAISAPLLSYP